jgi:hypothetical protein
LEKKRLDEEFDRLSPEEQQAMKEIEMEAKTHEDLKSLHHSRMGSIFLSRSNSNKSSLAPSRRHSGTGRGFMRNSPSNKSLSSVPSPSKPSGRDGHEHSFPIMTLEPLKIQMPIIEPNVPDGETVPWTISRLSILMLEDEPSKSDPKKDFEGEALPNVLKQANKDSNPLRTSDNVISIETIKRNLTPPSSQKNQNSITTPERMNDRKEPTSIQLEKYQNKTKSSSTIMSNSGTSIDSECDRNSVNTSDTSFSLFSCCIPNKT